MNGEVDAIVKGSMVPLARHYTAGIVIKHVGLFKWWIIAQSVIGALVCYAIIQTNTAVGYIYGALLALLYIQNYCSERLIERLTLLLIALGDGMKERSKDGNTNQTD